MTYFKNETLYQEAIKEYQADKNATINHLAKKYGFDRACFSKYMKKVGIEVDSQKSRTKENADRYDKAVKMYLEGYSIKKLHEELGVDRKNFSTFLKSQGIEVRGTKKKPNYKVDKTYFDVIDTPNKAYWLGFIYADGSVNVDEKYTHRVTIEIKDIDILHLHKFLKSLESNIVIKRRKDRPMVSVQVDRKHMVDTLIGYGCVPNKTELGFANVNLPKELIRDFLRGYLDGDGYIEKEHKKYRITYTVKSKKLFNYLFKLLKPFGPRKEVDKTFYRIHIERKETFFNLLDYLYKDAELFLDRKYRRYLDRIHAHLSTTL